LVPFWPCSVVIFLVQKNFAVLPDRDRTGGSSGPHARKRAHRLIEDTLLAGYDCVVALILFQERKNLI
jgi:hypothetical protein